MWNKKSKLLKDKIKLVRNLKLYSALKVAESLLRKNPSQNTYANTCQLRLSNESYEENPDLCLSLNILVTNNCDGLIVLKSISRIKTTKFTSKKFSQITVLNAIQSILNNL